MKILNKAAGVAGRRLRPAETICCVFDLQKRGFSCKISKTNLISSITKMQKGDTTWKV